MTYDEATTALAEGKFVRRGSWPAGTVVSPFFPNSGRLKVTSRGAMLVELDGDGWTLRSWRFQKDAPGLKEATDWEVVPEDKSGWPFV